MNNTISCVQESQGIKPVSYKVNNKTCIVVYKIKPMNQINLPCTYENQIKYNIKLHYIVWLDDSVGMLQDKFPYKYNYDGSLTLTNYTKFTTYFECRISTKEKKPKVLSGCKTGLILINPLRMVNIPQNATVAYNSRYAITCIGDGGDLLSFKMQYLVNDSVIEYKGPITIKGDTKIECLLKSNSEKLSYVAYIRYARANELTDEQKFVMKECTTRINNQVCGSYFKLDSKSRLNHTSSELQNEINYFLTSINNLLNNSYRPEFNEENCIDRFMRFICDSIYQPCISQQNSKTKFRDIPLCKDSCDTLTNFICPKTLVQIEKKLSKFADKYKFYIQKGILNEKPEYWSRYLMKFLSIIDSYTNCPVLLKMNITSNVKPCHLINFNLLPTSNPKSGKKSEDCYDGNGYYYSGKANNKNRCLPWKQMPSYLIRSFQSQNLINNSNYCRNPGGLFQYPICLIHRNRHGIEINNKSTSFQYNSFDNLDIIACDDYVTCEFMNKLKSANSNIFQSTNYNTILIVVTLFIVIIVIVIILVLYRRLSNVKCIHKNMRDVDSTELRNISLSNVQLSTNKLFMYKNVKYELDGCPIYNCGYFKGMKDLSKGAFGQIVLISIDNPDAIVSCDSSGVNFEKSTRLRKKVNNLISNKDKENIVDDLILSSDKEFHKKPCWPFDRTTGSGHCPFAVIKYCDNDNTSITIEKFMQETKLLSQFDHPFIIRFYGVIIDKTSKINARLVEYMPNGMLKTILTQHGQLGHNDPNKIKNNNCLTYSCNGFNKKPQGYESIGNININKRKRDSQLLLPKNNGIGYATGEGTKATRRTISSSSMNDNSNEPLQNCEHHILQEQANYIDLTNEQLLKWAESIADAISYLHHKHYLHRDIATRNCLVDRDLNVKLSDFTLTVKFVYGQPVNGDFKELIPIRWLPKRSLQDLEYTTETDVYMFGVFLWELMSYGQEPYSELEMAEAHDAILNKQLLEKPINCLDSIYDIMKKCWRDDNVPHFDEIKSDLVNEIHKKS